MTTETNDSSHPKAPPPPPPCVVPAPNAVAGLLEGLIGKKVTVRSGRPVVLSPNAPVAIATYVRDDGSVGAVCIFDMPLACAAGAALASIPPNVAEESVRDKKMSEAIYDNFKEVLNIASQIFCAPGGARVHSRNIYMAPPERVPSAAALVITKPIGRADLEISIPGYMAGTVTMLVR